jgi:flagellar motor protein MotB
MHSIQNHLIRNRWNSTVSSKRGRRKKPSSLIYAKETEKETFMDPVTTAILAALAAGAMSGVTEVSKTAITDAYQKLKGLLASKFGAKSKIVTAIDDLEEEHDSKGRQLTLQEQLAKVKADQDQELVQVAQVLLHEIRSQPGGEQHIQNAIGSYIAQASDHSTASVNVNRPPENQ